MEAVRSALARFSLACALAALSSCGFNFIGDTPFPAVDTRRIGSSIELSSLIAAELAPYYAFEVITKGSAEYPVLFLDRKADGTRLIVLDGKTLAIRARYTQAQLEAAGIADFKGRFTMVDASGALVIGNIRFPDLGAPPARLPLNVSLPGFSVGGAAGRNVANIWIENSGSTDFFRYGMFDSLWSPLGFGAQEMGAAPANRYFLGTIRDSDASADAVFTFMSQNSNARIVMWIPKAGSLVPGPPAPDFLQLGSYPLQSNKSAGGSLPDDLDFWNMHLTRDGLVTWQGSAKKWVLFDKTIPGLKDAFSIETRGWSMLAFGWTLDHCYAFDVQDRRVERLALP